MTYKQAFPDFELDVRLPEGFKDVSFHGDMMPTFSKELTDKSVIYLFIDDKDPEKRLSGGAERFYLHHSLTEFVTETPLDEKCCGEYHEALSWINSKLN